jgi:hypothetical protein
MQRDAKRMLPIGRMNSERWEIFASEAPIRLADRNAVADRF